LPPCPVDCIDMVAIEENAENWKWKYPVYKIDKVSERRAS